MYQVLASLVSIALLQHAPQATAISPDGVMRVTQADGRSVCGHIVARDVDCIVIRYGGGTTVIDEVIPAHQIVGLEKVQPDQTRMQREVHTALQRHNVRTLADLARAVLLSDSDF